MSGIFNTPQPRVRSGWIRWVHDSFGAASHCDECSKLADCWFLKSNMPFQPLHPNCHCDTEPVSQATVARFARANSDIRKFTEYIFAPVPKTFDSASKKKLFTGWGYSILDSIDLKAEFIRQGLEKYIRGEYTLGDLDEHGQRIDIRIELPRKDKIGTVSFVSGWMVYPNGKIQLNTPYGG